MTGINFDAMRTRWQRHIIRWGNGASFILRRANAADLPCVAAVIAYSPHERKGSTNAKDTVLWTVSVRK